MAPLHELKPHAESQQAICEMLHEHLKRAEAGEYTSVLICAFHVGAGGMSRESAGRYTTFDVIAALEIAKHAIIKNTEGG